MALFTRDNAAEMARRANLIRWSRPDPPAILPQLPEPGDKEIASITRNILMDTLSKLQDRPRIDPDDLDATSKAIERLWRVYAHSAGIAAPAHFKPERKSKREATMIDLAPEPLQVIDDRPASASPAEHISASSNDTVPSPGPTTGSTHT